MGRKEKVTQALIDDAHSSIFFEACDQKDICAKIEATTGVVLDAADLRAIIRLCEESGLI